MFESRKKYMKVIEAAIKSYKVMVINSIIKHNLKEIQVSELKSLMDTTENEFMNSINR